MINNRYNRFIPLRSPDEESGGGGDAPGEAPSQGLLERMNEFFPKDPDAPLPEPEPIVAKAKPAEKPQDQQDKPKQDPPAKTEEEEIDDQEEEDDFPEIGSTEQEKPDQDPEFDEAAFDAATEEEVKGMTKKAGEKFRELKSQLKELKKSKPATAPIPAEVEQELKTLRSKAEEADALRQRNQELLRINDDVAVRESDEFVSKVTNPIKEMEEVIAIMAETNNVQAETLFAIILEKDPVKQDKMIEEAERTLGRRGAGRIERFADDFKRIDQIKREMLENASKTIAQSREQREGQERAQKEARLGEFRSSTKASFEKYSTRFPGLADSNGQLSEAAWAIMTSASAIDPETLSPSDLGFMAFAAKALPGIRKEIQKLQEENRVLKGGKATTRPLSGDPKPTKIVDDGAEPKGFFESLRDADLTFGPV